MAYTATSVATYYIALFAPRIDAYAHWTKAGWRPVRERLTPERVLAGWASASASLSAYMIAPGNVSHVAAIDFDTEDGLVQAWSLAAVMRRHDLVPYVETSRRGAHLWCLLDRQVDAAAIRRSLRSLLVESGLPDDDPHIELRPGSDTIKEGGLGHPLRLPLMPHPKTGKVGSFHAPAGDAMGLTIAQVLLGIDQTPAEALVDRGRSYMPAQRRLPPRLPEWKRQRSEYDDASASHILMSMWGVRNAAPNKAVRCPAHDDRNPSLSILADDKRVICKAPGCILNNDDRGRGTYELTKMAPHG